MNSMNFKFSFNAPENGCAKWLSIFPTKIWLFKCKLVIIIQHQLHASIKETIFSFTRFLTSFSRFKKELPLLGLLNGQVYNENTEISSIHPFSKNEILSTSIFFNHPSSEKLFRNEYLCKSFEHKFMIFFHSIPLSLIL